MNEQNDVDRFFEAEGLLDVFRWAWKSASDHALDEHNPEVGHTMANLGLSAHNQLKDRIERGGQTGMYRLPAAEPDENSEQPASGQDVLHAGLTGQEIRSMITLDPGRIVRSDLNGSPGFLVGGYRVLLQSHTYDQVHEIRWTQKSETKQRAARQANPDQYSLFEDPESYPPAFHTQDLPILVLAHAIDPNTGSCELHLGRPCLIEQNESAWHWIIHIKDATPQSPSVVHQDDSQTIDPNEGVPDVVVRRRRRSEEGVS